MQTHSHHRHPAPQLDVAEARRILTNPTICAEHPSLRRLAFFAMATARGTPMRQITRQPAPTRGGAA